MNPQIKEECLTISPYPGGGWQIRIEISDGRVLDHLGVYFSEPEAIEIARDEAFIRHLPLFFSESTR